MRGRLTFNHMTDAARTDSRDRPGSQGDLTEALYFLTKELMRLVEALHDNNHKAILTRIDQLERKIMATQSELAADLGKVLSQQLKTTGEIATVQASVDALKAEVARLEKIIADGGGTGAEVTQELIDAVAAVKAQAQVIDDAIPDAPQPPVEGLRSR